MLANELADMTGSQPPKHRHRRKAVTERSVASAPAWRAIAAVSVFFRRRIF
jgi:hypothetical protein